MWWQILPGWFFSKIFQTNPVATSTPGQPTGHTVREPLSKIQKIIKEMNP